MNPSSTSRSVFSLFLTAAAVACLLTTQAGLQRRAGAEQDAVRTAVPPPETPAARTTSPASAAQAAPTPEARQYPSEALAAACRESARQLRARLDDSFAVVARPPFVVAGNMPTADLERIAAGSVVRPAKALWASYFRVRPDGVITVLLFADAASYRTWADRLFGDASVPYFGYYKHAQRALVMNIATGTGTLVHELTHALIAYDFPQVPTWFNEGLASLHEQCTVGEDRITGLPNWRLPALQKAAAEGKLRPLRDLITRRDFRDEQVGLNYAQARYFVMYMQHEDLLKAFYERLRDAEGGDTDAEVVRAVFGRTVEEVEKGFLRWVKTLKFPG